MTSFAEATRASRLDLLYLIKGKDAGREAWWYILLHNTQVAPIFLKKLGIDGEKISDYGEVIRCGWGKEPPDEVRKNIAGELKNRVKSAEE